MNTRIFIANSALAFFAFASHDALAQARNNPCIHYEPDTVAISGKLTRITFFGAPGFGEDTTRDARETGFYLDLAKPVCTSAARGADNDDAKTNVTRIQLVLDSAGFAKLRSQLGKTVTVRGTMFGEFTGHHHAPLLLDVLKPVTLN